jgi:hypothetical protein
VFWAFVIAFVFSLSLGFSVSVLLACRSIIPIALLHFWGASDVEIGIVGLMSVVIFSFMCIRVVAWSLAAYG